VKVCLNKVTFGHWHAQRQINSYPNLSGQIGVYLSQKVLKEFTGGDPENIYYSDYMR
jgi:hypothetical protein